LVSNGVRVGGRRLGRNLMEAAALLEMPAVEARERLAALVGEVTSVLWLPVQRQNALLYVRGLVEQGGRKSLQPTLFRRVGCDLPVAATVSG
jgi:hypothetical protein